MKQISHHNISRIVMDDIIRDLYTLTRGSGNVIGSDMFDIRLAMNISDTLKQFRPKEMIERG
jgi:hypothetical protein